jgi:hypothetical protein
LGLKQTIVFAERCVRLEAVTAKNYKPGRRIRMALNMSKNAVLELSSIREGFPHTPLVVR